MSQSVKRKAASHIDALLPAKKQRLKHREAVSPLAILAKKKINKRPVGFDDLRWKQTRLPDRFEDAGGFYSLEEIDDVEVVRAKDGQISFRTPNGSNARTDDRDEWVGFDDPSRGHEFQKVKVTKDDINGDDAANVDVTPQETLTTERLNPGKKTKSKNATRTIDDESMVTDPAISFSTLADVKDASQADVSAWKELEISPDILAALSNLGFSQPTAIQRAAINLIQEGKDVIGKAVTGSGKTLAFGIPIIEYWLKKNNERVTNPNVVALVLAPTRELTHQLSKHLSTLCRGLDRSPRITTITGGLSILKQQRQLESAEIIIGTPGRLWEVISGSSGLVERMKQMQFLVIDEADRLLSEGHFQEVEEILDTLDRKVIDQDDTAEQESMLFESERHRQTLVFSATFHKGLQQKLAGKQKWRPEKSNLLTSSQSLEHLLSKLRFQNGVKPTFIDASPTSQMAENLTESVLECAAMSKDLHLYSLLLFQQHDHTKRLRTSDTEDVNRTLIFTNSISTVKRLAALLTTLCLPDTLILSLQSGMPQKSRLRSLERFTEPSGGITNAILVASDVAARGLDIKDINTIVHYHVPRTADAYVHRSGRTARSEASGRSILICSPEETQPVTRLINRIHAEGSRSSETRPSSHIQPIYLPASLPQQLQGRVNLAQKISTAALDTSTTKSESHWLKQAADELGVDYSSDEFERQGKAMRRGRGGGRDQKRKQNAESHDRGDAAQWKAQLKEDLKTRRVNFGDSGGVGTGLASVRFLAGGAVDMERLLIERDKEKDREQRKRN